MPNCITCLNVLCGVLAIITTSLGKGFWGMESWECGALFIILAAVADFFDGFVARLLHASHPIGADLDSLSDEVSFGVAPAILLVYTFWGTTPEWLAWAPAILPVATAVRLAKFNVDTRQTNGFLGLPVPANAVFWIGYAACVKSGSSWLLEPWVAVLSLLLMSAFMVSEIPMVSLKFKTWGIRGNLERYLLIIGAAGLFLAMQLEGLIWIIALYAVISFIGSLLGSRRR